MVIFCPRSPEKTVSSLNKAQKWSFFCLTIVISLLVQKITKITLLFLGDKKGKFWTSLNSQILPFLLDESLSNVFKYQLQLQRGGIIAMFQF
jgi:hypothetical protein